MNIRFNLWLEFEEIDPVNWDKENEFCNIHIDLEDGRHYGINVWTYKYLETAINNDKKNRRQSKWTLSKTTRFVCKRTHKRMYSTDY